MDHEPDGEPEVLIDETRDRARVVTQWHND
jgi:hypothetical protein